MKWKVLIVDDSAIARGIMEKNFMQSPFFDVVTSVSNGRKAVDFCRDNTVDVVVTDYDMPEMDGAEAARVLSHELGICVCVYAESMEKKNAALDAGALMFIKRPSFSSYNPKAFGAFIEEIHATLEKKKIRPKTADSPSAVPARADEKNQDRTGQFKVLCIGASTGGPAAVKDVLNGLGKEFPLPILYVQHIDVGADAKMVAWFNSVCPDIPMHLVQGGEDALPGNAYMACADGHLVIDFVKKDGTPVLRVSDEMPERFLRPAVNKLFRSAAHQYKEECLAVLLTGMGRDGAEGCKEIVDSGGFTIAEDSSTCAVFGMPAAAIELGAAKSVLPRNNIPAKILSLVKSGGK